MGQLDAAAEVLSQAAVDCRQVDLASSHGHDEHDGDADQDFRQQSTLFGHRRIAVWFRLTRHDGLSHWLPRSKKEQPAVYAAAFVRSRRFAIDRYLSCRSAAAWW